MTAHPDSARPDSSESLVLPPASAGLTTRTSIEPDEGGHFGVYGGRHVPEALMAVIDEVTTTFYKLRTDDDFLAELDRLQRDYAGRPSPLYEAKRLAEYAGGARIFLKREDLNHTGSHKINNVLGQALLAQRMGKNRIIAETGAGQHGVATATACALLGLECVIYMGRVDTDRQALNVARMRLLGAEVIAVDNGSATLKDAINEAMRDWVTNAHNTYYCFGTAAGPHPPFPVMVRDLQRVVGLEARAQILAKAGRLPDAVTACVGGGSNAIGIFHPSSTTPPFVWSGSRRPVTASKRAVTQRLSPAARRVRSRARTRTCCRTRTGRRSNRIRSPRVSTIRVSAPRARLPQGHRPGRVPPDHRHRGDGGAGAVESPRGDHPPPSSPPMRSPVRSSWARNSGRARSSS